MQPRSPRSRSIVLVVPEYPPHHVGGGGIAFRAIAQHLLAHFERVTVLAGDYTGASGSETSDGITVHRVPLYRTPASRPYLRGYLPPRRLLDLRKALRHARAADVVHVHGCALPICDLAARLFSIAGVRYFLTNHGFPRTPYGSDAGMLGALFRLYERTLTRAAVLRARQVSAVSAYCKADGPLALRDVDVIPNGIDESWLSVEGSGARRDDTLLYVGRIEYDKGLGVLLDAIALDPRWKLRVIGDDAGYERAARDRVAALGIAGRVAFLGRLDESAVRGELQAAYALVVPSLKDSFGIVGLEAMAVRTLLVSSDTGGMREYASPSNALLFSTGDPQALAAVLRSCPLPESQRLALTDAAYETATRFTWSRVVRQYDAWYAA